MKKFSISVEVLVEKYGQGEVYVRKCETCEFEQTVRTAGTHVNGDNGSVMVFADDDEFVCPNCVMNTPFEEDKCNQSILTILLFSNMRG